MTAEHTDIQIMAGQVRMTGKVGESLLFLSEEQLKKEVGLIPIFWDASSYDELVREHRELIRGGRWRPESCTARHRVAIIVPYRDRDVHLRKLLQHLHPFLQKQQLDYAIYVIEQEDSSSKFNRAMLFNIGYKEALQLHEYDCVIFHDVDLLPEDDRNIYACPQPKEPRHMTAAIDKFKYKLPYAGLFGGASAIRVEDFKTVNGFSNLYFGWGAEDDDMFERLQMGGMQIKRYPMHIARYRAMPHEPASTYNDRYKYLKTMQTRYDKDGINNLKYERLSLRELPLYTWVHVRLNETQVREDFPIPRVNQVPKALDFDNMAEWGTDGKDETLEGSEWEAPSYRTIVNGSAIRHLLPNTNTITNRPKSDVNGTKPRLSPPGDRETDDTPSRHKKRYSRTRRKLRNGRSKGGEAELDELIADLRKKQGKIT